VSCYFEGSYTAKDIGCMGLRIRDTSKRAIVVSAAEYIVCSFLCIDLIESVEDMQAGNSDVREASVNLSPLVTKEGAIWLLETTDVFDHLRSVDLSECEVKYSRWL